MRSFILSVSDDRWLTPIRNTVLAHAGYAVIPAYSADLAMDILTRRHVSVMVIGHSIAIPDRQRLASEGQKRGIPSVILDQNEGISRSRLEAHVNPLDGPEAVLEAIAAVLSSTQQ
jgi:hypothetical protein